MGLPVESALPIAEVPSGAELLEAAFSMEVESYESFARLLPSLGQAESSSASVHQELERLQINPEVFYRDARPLGFRRFTADDVDPFAAAGEEGALRFQQLRELLASAGEEGGFGFSPAPRLEVATADEGGLATADAMAQIARSCPFVPELGEVEDMPYEEISLEGATSGGRLGRQTPEGLKTRLQVDSLTDEGDDEDDFRAVLLTGDQQLGGGETAIEAFSLDPDFDYDDVSNLTSKWDT